VHTRFLITAPLMRRLHIVCDLIFVPMRQRASLLLCFLWLSIRTLGFLVPLTPCSWGLRKAEGTCLSLLGSWLLSLFACWWCLRLACLTLTLLSCWVVQEVEEICRDEYCARDEKTGEPILLSVKEKERIFLDCIQSYYYNGRCDQRRDNPLVWVRMDDG
jgi:hypothetical protein